MVTSDNFYHIHKAGTYDHLWVPGNTFTVDGKERNEFIRYYDTVRIGVQIEDGGPIIPMKEATEKFLALSAEIQQKIYPIYFQFAHKAIKEMGTYIREVIFEEIRKQEFPRLPSRMKAIWVCEEKDVQYWLPWLHSGEKAIYRVSLNGVMHRGNPENLISDSVEHQLLRELARKYWIANDLDKAPAHEILFQGEVTVHEKLSVPDCC
jgi:Protein of unknown function (DUF2441)